MANQPRTKTAKNKKGKKNGVSGSSFFTWFMVIALLGVWTSVAVVWFDLVDYEEVLGKLGIYDADGDGDFDVDDAKVLLGLKERPEAAQATLEEEPSRPDETSPFDIDDIGDLEDVEERIQASHIHEALRSKSDENEDDDLEETPPVEDEGNMETEFLLEDFFDDEKEELSEDGQFEEDVQLDEGVPVEPLSSHDLHGEPKQDLEGPEEEEPTDAGATYEAETEDAAHGHEEEVEEAEPELSEIYGTTEQENEYIPDKHPDEKEEKAVPVEGQKEHLSDI